MNGRVYSPETGRFLSPDPLVQAPTYSQSFNRYSYVWNNPLNNIDPSGFAAKVVGGVSSQEDGGRQDGCDGPTPKSCSNFLEWMARQRDKRYMAALEKAAQACQRGMGQKCQAALIEVSKYMAGKPEGMKDIEGSSDDSGLYSRGGEVSFTSVFVERLMNGQVRDDIFNYSFYVDFYAAIIDGSSWNYTRVAREAFDLDFVNYESAAYDAGAWTESSLSFLNLAKGMENSGKLLYKKGYKWRANSKASRKTRKKNIDKHKKDLIEQAVDFVEQKVLENLNAQFSQTLFED